MKRLTASVLFGVCMFFFACTEKGTGTAASNDYKAMADSMLKTNREMYRAIESGDSATISKHIAADAIDHAGGPSGEDLKGDGIVRMLTGLHNDIDNLKFEVLEEAANENHVFALVHMTGTTNKAVWGMPAGRKMDSRSIDLIKINNGKMTDHWAFFEMAEVMKMMGTGKPAETIIDTAR